MAVDSSYLAPMVIVLIILIGAFGFALYYYYAQLKPRLDMMVFDKTTGVVGFRDNTGTVLLLKPPTANTNESSHLQLQNPPSKAGYNFDMYTTPIPNNTKGQVQMNFTAANGAGYVLPLT